MRVNIEIEDMQSYEIFFLNQMKRSAGSLVSDWLSLHPRCSQVVIVTDTNVAGVQESYINEIHQTIAESGITVVEVTVPEGELSKSLQTCEMLWEKFSDLGITRSDLLIAFGGGMIGDLVGFCAATYLRGVSFIQIPTTLLSQIDSSVGGKVAINLPLGKNLVGQFYNPEMVLIDTRLLQTLKPSVLQDGLGELLKYAFMGDVILLNWLEQQQSVLDIQKVILESPEAFEFVIQRCLEIKKVVVEKDFKEAHERKWLNLGHTFGHAIERAEGYRLGHGYCVVLGLYLAGEIGWRLLEMGKQKSVEAEGYASFKALLSAYMTRFDFKWQLSVEFKALLPFLMQDKKRVASEIQMILPRFESWANMAHSKAGVDAPESLLDQLRDNLDIRSIPLSLIEMEMVRFEL